LAAVANSVGMKWFMPESSELRSTGFNGMAGSKYAIPSVLQYQSSRVGSRVTQVVVSITVCKNKH
jgi:hypothetical protein